MVKGGTLKDDADWSKLGIKDGHTFMMMGTADADIPKAPVQQTVFVEDLTEDEVSSLGAVETLQIRSDTMPGCLSSRVDQSWKHLLHERYYSVSKSRARTACFVTTVCFPL